MTMPQRREMADSEVQQNKKNTKKKNGSVNRVEDIAIFRLMEFA